MEFKDVYQYYVGARVLRRSGMITKVIAVTDNDTLRTYETAYFDDSFEFKPILYPMSHLQSRWREMPGTTDYCPAYRTALTPEQFHWLIKERYNVFNLPDDQFIDVTTLKVNPYV